MKRPLALLFAGSITLLLAACGGSDQTASVPQSWSTNNTLTYAYPYNGQAEIAPTAPVVLHFADKLSETSATALKSHFSISGSGNPDFTVSIVDGGRGVVLQPTSKLTENTSYSVAWTGLASTDGDIKPVPITFKTRAASKGPRSLVSEGNSFTVARSLPVQSNFPFMDFSSLRLQFTQPIDSKTLEYGLGKSVSLEDASGALVPARLLASKRLLTIDPVNDLVPGQKYTLKLSSALKSTLGDSLTPGSYSALELTPKDSKPRATTALLVGDSGTGTNKIVSPLTGAPINNVPITSTLLGNESASQQIGNLFAELAFVPNYPDATPLRVPRGNMLVGSSVDVKIVGKVPANLNTGAVKVNIISDANGYMTANPYSNSPNVPRQVYLVMDAAMSSENSSANGAFNQNIMHIEVVGTAIVKDGKLVMDGVGVAELDVLGLDQAAGVLSFHLEGYENEHVAPSPVPDTTAPALQSWVPGDVASDANAPGRARPGDPVTLTFTEPLDPASINSTSLQFLRGGVAEPFSWRADGSSIVIKPTAPLMHGANYTVQMSTDIKDLAGNGLVTSYSKQFTMSALSNPASRSPVVLAAYPGYPCVTTGSSVSVSGSSITGTQGRCAGGKTSGLGTLDDQLPIPELPVDRSIAIQFSQSMNAASINNASFKVETSSNGSSWTTVPGRLEVSEQSLRFYPDTKWEAGKLLRYTLASNGSMSSSSCNAGTQICGSNGLPLQTQILAADPGSAPAATGGGPNMVIMFKTVPAVSSTLQRLRGLPTSDVNANFLHDAGEFEATGSGDDYSAVNAARIKVDTYSGLVTGARIGCDPDGADCPLKQFLFLSTALDADVADFDADLNAVKVLIQPTQIIASSIDVVAKALGQTLNAPTGPQIMRVRYAVNPANGKRELPITGYITNDGNGLRLSATLDLYLDEPNLNAQLFIFPVTHNLHSYPLSAAVSGPVQFLPDGRMLATLQNDDDTFINVSLLGGLGGSITLLIPAGTLKMQGLSGPIKQ
ncbi:MAG: Ig-like domain-containing protein [Pedobacter sp.]|nr:Ig-like domain-containing protein [Pedobacter sp.]